jgi:hypothetical protein
VVVGSSLGVQPACAGRCSDRRRRASRTLRNPQRQSARRASKCEFDPGTI